MYVKAAPVANLVKGKITGKNIHLGFELPVGGNQDMVELVKDFQRKRGQQIGYAEI